MNKFGQGPESTLRRDIDLLKIQSSNVKSKHSNKFLDGRRFQFNRIYLLPVLQSLRWSDSDTPDPHNGVRWIVVRDCFPIPEPKSCHWCPNWASIQLHCGRLVRDTKSVSPGNWQQSHSWTGPSRPCPNPNELRTILHFYYSSEFSLVRLKNNHNNNSKKQKKRFKK